MPEVAQARYRRGAGGSWEIRDETPPARVAWILDDPDTPDSTTAANPDYAKCHPTRLTVRAGETLYLPALWFHQVGQTGDAHGRTIAVNFWYDIIYDSISYTLLQFMKNAVASRRVRTAGGRHAQLDSGVGEDPDRTAPGD